MDDLIDKLKSKYGIGGSGEGKSKIQQAAELIRSKGYDIDDDTVADFDKVTGLESSRSHYAKPGVVKRGPRTKTGEQAIGYSQIMPSTAKKYQGKDGLDPENELDNIAMGLAEYKAGADDPVGRRIAYVGGPKSKALEHYRRTGQVPDWKLYSYLPGNKETYRSYVERSGGFEKKSDAKPFDYNAAMESVTGKKRPASAPGTSPAEPSAEILPPDTPFNEWPPKRAVSPTVPGEPKANIPSLGGVYPKRDTTKPGSYYEFEKTGKTKEGDEYLGMVGDRFRFRNADGDEFELDPATSKVNYLGMPKRLKFDDGELVRGGDNRYSNAKGEVFEVTKTDTGYIRKPVDQKLTLKLESGETLTEVEDEPNAKKPLKPLAEGEKRLRDAKGRTYIATVGEKSRDKAGNESTSYSIRPESPVKTLKRVKGQAAGEVEIGEEAKTYDFERTGRLKLMDGSELELIRGEEAPEGKFRFRDKDGETYLFDKETGRVEDESLNAIAERVPVTLLPATQKAATANADLAKDLRAREVAVVIGAKYGLDATDLQAFLKARGFVDWQTKKELPLERYFETDEQARERGSKDLAAAQPGQDLRGQKPPARSVSTDTHFVTRRDLRDAVLFARAEQKKREDAVVKMIEQGDTPSDALLRMMRLDPERFKSERYEDLQLAAVKGQVSRDMLERVMPQVRKADDDDYTARIKAKKRLGFVDAKTADSEVAAYKRLRDEQFKELSSQARYTGGTAAGTELEGIGLPSLSRPVMEREVQRFLDERVRRYGSATEYIKKRDQAEAEERARQERVKAMGWGEYALATPQQLLFGTMKGGLKQLISESMRGAVVWTGGLVDLLESATGADIKQGREFNERHPLYKASKTVDQYLDWALRTNKDLDQEFALGKVPQGVGSSLAFIFPSMAKNPKTAIALWSTLTMGGGSFEEAKQAGASDEEAQMYAMLNSGLFGWTEIVGVGEAFSRLNKGIGGTVWRQWFRQSLPSFANEAAEEIFLNEGPQTIGQNVLAGLTFDPDRKWDKNLLESIAVAGVSVAPISFGVTAINTIRNQRAIKQQLALDEIHGGPHVRNFGEAGVYVYGKQVPLTPELAPLIEKHKQLGDELRFGYEAIERVRAKAMSLPVEQRYNYWRTIRDLREAQFETLQEQRKTADEIVKASGAVKPAAVDEQAKEQDLAKGIAPDEQAEQQVPETDGFDVTHEDGRRMKILDDRESSLLVADDRGRITLQPPRKFADLEAWREQQRLYPKQYDPAAGVKPVTAPEQEEEFVTERPVTLDAQAEAMLDEKLPNAIGLLYTDPKTAQNRPAGTTDFVVPDGVLRVNNEKFKAKYGKGPGQMRTEIESGAIPLVDLIGGKVVEDADTTRGTAAVTVDAEGNELNATKIADDLKPRKLTAQAKEGSRWIAVNDTGSIKKGDVVTIVGAQDHGPLGVQVGVKRTEPLDKPTKFQDSYTVTTFIEPDNEDFAPLTPELETLVDKQAELDRKRFGDKAAETGIAPTEEIIDSRQEDREINITPTRKKRAGEIDKPLSAEAPRPASPVQAKTKGAIERFNERKLARLGYREDEIANLSEADRKKILTQRIARRDFFRKTEKVITPVRLEKPVYVEIHPSTRRRLKKTHTANRIRKQGYTFTITSKKTVHITHAPAGMDPEAIQSQFDEIVYEQDEKRREKIGRGNIANLRWNENMSLSQAVRAFGGIRPDKQYAMRGLLGGELERLSNKGAGEFRNKRMHGLINRNSEYNAEEMGNKLQQLGYLFNFKEDYGNEFIGPDQFLELVEEDAVAGGKYYTPVGLNNPMGEEAAQNEIDRHYQKQAREEYLKNALDQLTTEEYKFAGHIADLLEDPRVWPMMEEVEFSNDISDENRELFIKEAKRYGIDRSIANQTVNRILDYVQRRAEAYSNEEASPETERSGNEAGDRPFEGEDSIYAEGFYDDEEVDDYDEDLDRNIEPEGEVDTSFDFSDEEDGTPENEPSTEDLFKQAIAEIRAESEPEAGDEYDEIAKIMGFKSVVSQSDLPLDEKKLDALRPHFEKAISRFEDQSGLEQMKSFVRALSEKFSLDQVEQLQPYVMRFFADRAKPATEPAAEPKPAKEIWQMTLKELQSEASTARAMALGFVPQRPTAERGNQDQQLRRFLADAHRKAVLDAVREGKDVPRKNREKYADLLASADPAVILGKEKAKLVVRTVSTAEARIGDFGRAAFVEPGGKVLATHLTGDIEAVYSAIESGDILRRDSKRRELGGGLYASTQTALWEGRVEGEPQELELTLKGRFIEFSDAPYLTDAEVDALVAAGFDGAFTPGGGKAFAEIAVWRAGAIDKAEGVADDFDPEDLSATDAAHDAATSPENDLPEPTQAQKEAGNYQKGHIRINGIDISIENPVGSTRSGVDPDGEPWSVTMKQHYGYIKRTVGADEEQIDVFVKDGTPADFDGSVYIVDQVDPETGEFDEHKVMLGFADPKEAGAAYLGNYAAGWRGFGTQSAMSFDEFKKWLASEQVHPAAETAYNLLDGPPNVPGLSKAPETSEQAPGGMLFDPQGLDEEGLFAQGGPKAIGETDKGEAARDKQRQLDELKQKQRDADRAKNIKIFGEYEGSMLDDISRRGVLTRESEAAKAVLARRNDIARLGADAMDLIENATAAIVNAANAQLEGTDYKTYAENLSLLGDEGDGELTDDQRAIYFKVAAGTFTDAFDKAVDDMLEAAGKKKTAPAITAEPEPAAAEPAPEPEQTRPKTQKEAVTETLGEDLAGKIEDLEDSRVWYVYAPANVVAGRHKELAAAGQAGLDLAADAVTAIEEINEALVRGIPFEEYPKQSWIGKDEMTPRQRAIYDKIAAPAEPGEFFSDYFDKLIKQLGEKEAADVTDSGSDLEPDSERGTQDGVREEVSQTRPGRDDQSSRESDGESREGGSGAESGARFPRGGADARRARSDTDVRGETSDDTALDTRGDDDGRSGLFGDPGTLFDYQPSDAVREAARPAGRELTDKLERQKAAESIPTKVGDINNIRATLPFLLPEQQDDVKFAEDRFEKGDGVLFTNSTGTGKTYTGLGIIKRFHRQGKSNILVVAPNDKILEDWQRSATNLRIPTKRLASTADNGRAGVVVTTYANFRANNELINRKWDLVLFDESHYLSQNKDGDETGSVTMLRAIGLHPRGEFAYGNVKNAELIAEVEALQKEIRPLEKKHYWNRTDEENAKLDRLNGRLDPLLGKLAEKQEEAAEEFRSRRAKEGSSKVVFLSATPFAYEKNIEYAEGYLFSYGPEVDSSGYNSGDAKERFFMQHFGYRMRYNKLTKPDADVNTELMEMQFNEMLQKEGSLSGRSLDIDQDYSRQFVMVPSAIGQKIDEGFSYLSDNSGHDGKYSYSFVEALRKRFNYLAKRFTLEAINAQAAVPIVRQQLELGRQVVVFHDYNQNRALHPFDDIPDTVVLDGQYVNIKEDRDRFYAERPDLVNLDLSGLASPSDVFNAAFGPILGEFNGTIPAKTRRLTVSRFNDDRDELRVFLVQSDAGREGISLHDTTGKHQRVLINLGLPVRPIAAVQTEGRIYRVGNKTDAVQLYMTTGTNFEQYAFGTRISQRASTAENLALGFKARALRQSFIDGYIDAVSDYTPSLEEGKGGKEADRASQRALTDWDRAIGFYFGQGKKTARNKSAEGTDYYATPEPIGLKMVEWADQRVMEGTLEPSAGHGAIARWFRTDNRKTVVEPSQDLAARLALATDGRIVQNRFEALDTGANKYNTIVMNPPFGSGGRTAVDHLAKAARHLRNHGRIVALLPEGPAADAKLEKFLESDEAKDLYKIADFSLPGVAFARAATTVRTHIIVLEKQQNPNEVNRLPAEKRLDFSDETDVKNLFERIRDISVPDRVAPEEAQHDTGYDESADAPAAENETAPVASRSAEESLYERLEFQHTQKGHTVYVAKPKEHLGDDWTRISSLAKARGGYYSKFKRDGAIAGFHFKTAEDRDKFVREADGPGPLRSVVGRVEAPAFYSAAERAIEAKMPQRASAEQVRSILNGPGVKQDEVKWLGIELFLEQKDVFTKQEVVDFIRSNNVQLEERMHGDRSGKWTPLKDGTGFQRRIGNRWSFIYILSDGSVQGQGPSKFVQKFPSVAAAMAHYDAQDDSASLNPTGYAGSALNLAGGEDYRELLLTIPTPKLTDEQLIRYSELTETAFTRHLTNDEILERGALDSFELGHKYISLHWSPPNYPQTIENVVVHIRFGSRDGGRTLHIVEIQSDWHQDGRKKGYKLSAAQRKALETALREAAAEVKRTREALQKAITDRKAATESKPETLYLDGKKVAEIDSSKGEGFGHLISRIGREAWDAANLSRRDETDLRSLKNNHNENVVEGRWSLKRSYRLSDNEQRAAEGLTTANHAYNRAVEAFRDVNRRLVDADTADRVADAPFKKTWHELAFKRILRYAVENGYERVTWDTGDTQNDRYDLRKTVEKITYAKNQIGGGTHVEVYPKGSHENVSKTVRSEKELTEFVGKEIADRILEGPQTGTLKGINLKVGGEGMRGFYDKIIPDFVRKYVKKWGAKVEKGGLRAKPFDVMEGGSEVRQTIDVDGLTTVEWGSESREFENADEAQAFADSLIAKGENTPVHSLTITPEMRESVLSGQPLFQKRTASALDTVLNKAPVAHTQDVLTRIESRMVEDEYYPKLEVNEWAGEQLRRLLGERYYRQTGREMDVDVADGYMWGAGDLLSLVSLGREIYVDYLRAGYTEAQLAPYSKLLDDLEATALVNDDYAIVYLFDDAIAEEEFHYEDAKAGQTDSVAMLELKGTDLWINPGEKFSRDYANISDADKASELAAKLATGQAAKYGWDRMENFEEMKKRFLDIWLDGVLRKNDEMIQLRGAEAFLNDFRRLKELYYADTKTDAEEAGGEVSGETSPGGPARGEDAGPGDAPRKKRKKKSARQRRKKNSDRRAQGFAERTALKERLEAMELGVEVGEVRAKNRKFAQTLRDNGRSADDVPYIPGSDPERIIEAKAILRKSREMADAGLTQSDYEYALETFYNPDTEPRTKTVLGIALIDHLGAAGDVDVMNYIAEKTIIHVGEAAQALQAASIAAKYDFARAVVLAKRIMMKEGKPLTEDQINEIRALTSALQNSEREKALIAQTLADAEQVIAELQADVGDIDESLAQANAALLAAQGENVEMAAALDEQGLELEQKERLIENLRRQIARWKNKFVKGDRIAARMPKEYTELLERKSAIRARLEARFPGRPLRSVVGASDKFDDATRQDLVDYTAILIYEGESYEDVIGWLGDFTAGVLNADEVAAIHADAEYSTRKAKTEKTAEAVAKLKNRGVHRRAAERFRKGEPATEKAEKAAGRAAPTRTTAATLNRIDREILSLAGNERLGVAGVLVNHARRLDDWFVQMKKDYPELSDSELDTLFVEAKGLLERAKRQLEQERAEKTANIKFLTGEQFEDWKAKQVVADAVARRHRSTLDAYFRKLREGFSQKAFEVVNQITGIGKGLSATGELSMLLRQNLLLWITHPARTLGSLEATLRGIASVTAGARSVATKDTKFGNAIDAVGDWSETQFLAYMERLRNDPYFDDAQAHRLEFTNIGDFNIQDEHFVANVFFAMAEARKLWFRKNANAAFNAALAPVRIFGRTYKAIEVSNTLFGDAARLATYRIYAEHIDAMTALSAAEKRKAKMYAARAVNAFGGRGDMKGVLGSNGVISKLANIAFFSLRLLISRPQSLWYLTGGFALAPRGMRLMMASEGAKFYAFLTMLAILAGLRLDPWDKDFGKIKPRFSWMPDFNVDVLGGMDAPLQWLFGVAVGSVSQIGAMARGEESDVMRDMLEKLFERYWFNVDAAKKEGSWLAGLRYWRGKSSPAVSLGFDYFTGKDFIGREFRWDRAVASRLVPLAYQQTYQTLYYDRNASVMKEPTAAVSPEADVMAGLMMILGTGIGFGITQYPNEDSTRAEQAAWEMYEPYAPNPKKSMEQKRVETGLRNLYRMRKEQIAAGSDTSRIDEAIAKYAGLYSVDARLLKKLQLEGEGKKFDYVTEKFTTEQVEKLLALATDGERPELEKILDAKRRSEAKSEAKKLEPPKPLANRLNTADVADAVRLWGEYGPELNAKQTLEFKRKLREKVMNSNARRQLSREDYDAARAILGTLPPYRGETKRVKPVRGLDSMKQVY